MSRSTGGDSGEGRFALLGASPTACEASVRFGSAPTGIAIWHSLIARYVDAGNYLRIYVDTAGAAGALVVSRKAGGATAGLVRQSVPLVRGAWYQLRAVVFASGHGVATLLSHTSDAAAEVTFFDAALATGGALASGQAGFGDYWTGPSDPSPTVRYYDDFYAAAPAPEPIVVHSGRSIEFRHDAVLRQDAAGTYAGPPPEYVGGQFFVPPAGSAGRKARVAVIARRNDVTVSADDHIADSTTVEVFVTPRFLTVPR